MRNIVLPALGDWNAIIVAPDCPTQSWTSAIARSAVLGLLDEVMAGHAVDRERMLVSGFSLGGIGTWFFATTYPERFTGAIPVAGSPRDFAIDALDEMPVFAIHSRDDELIPFDPTQAAVEALGRQGTPVRLTELRGVGHFTMGDYIEPLRVAGQWMLEHWAEQER